MAKNDANLPDPTADESGTLAEPDAGDLTPPHGDEIVNDGRHISPHDPAVWIDPDDRPAR